MRVLTVGLPGRDAGRAVRGAGRRRSLRRAPRPDRVGRPVCPPIARHRAWSFVGPLTDAGERLPALQRSGRTSCRAPVSTWTAARSRWRHEDRGLRLVGHHRGGGPALGVRGGARLVHRSSPRRTPASPTRPAARRFFANLPYPYLQVRNWNYILLRRRLRHRRHEQRRRRLPRRAPRYGPPGQPGARRSRPSATSRPNHPYFRFIEALADARIIGGCGNGRFCPDRPADARRAGRRSSRPLSA